MSTTFPYPPRSGFATRAYQLARQLAAKHDVTLLSYADRSDAEGVERLRDELDVETVARERSSSTEKRVRQLSAVVSRRPFSSEAVHSITMQDAIDRLCSVGSFDAIQLESSPLCVFRFPGDVPLVLDEHNVEYEVFERLRDGESSLTRRTFYRFEHRRFRRFEETVWRRVAACVVTSIRDGDVVRASAPGTPVAVVPNSVDLEYFRPNGGTPEPRTIVFNGVLDYRPNVDAARFLVDDILPIVRRRFPDVRLTIVGRGGPSELEPFRVPGVEVTGEVPDVRPFLERAAVVVVPLRMGGGTRLKVVEGLAMSKPMVSTTLGCEGIDVGDGRHLLVADTADAFAESTMRLFDDAELAGAIGRAGRALVEQSYSWDSAGRALDELYRSVLRGAAR